MKNLSAIAVESILSCLLLLSFSTENDASAQRIFVSPKGKDSSSCGSHQNPCRTLIHSMEKRAKTNDVVKIDGLFKTLEMRRPILAVNTKFSRVLVSSFNGIPTITMKTNDSKYFMSFKGVLKRNSTYEVTIANLRFRNVNMVDMRKSKIDVSEMRLSFESCRFAFDVSATSHIIVRFKIPTFLFEMKNCVVDGSDIAQLLDVSVSVHNTTFIGITLENSNFYNLASAIRAVHLNVNHAVVSSRLDFLVKNSSFHSSPRAMQKSSLFKIASSMYHQPNPVRVYVKFVASIFAGRSLYPSEDQAAILVVIGFTHFAAIWSRFYGNSASKGGVLYLNTRSRRTISHCVFQNNRAITPSICGDDSLSGNGGAILINGKAKYIQTKITNVTFKNNVASCFGDSIYAVNSYDIVLADSTFESGRTRNIYENTKKMSGQTVWYTESTRLSISRINVIVQGPSHGSSTIFFVSAMQFKHKSQSHFQCPLGSNIRIIHKTLDKMKKQRIDCIKCPDNTYTIGASYANTTSFASAGNVTHQVQCQKCPFGAICKDGLKPKPNFWGYVHRGSVKMISCPPGYCCQIPSECKHIGSCHGKRIGTLCGQCDREYYLSLFSNSCIPKKTCSMLKSWGVVIALAFLCLMVLAFMEEVLELLMRIFTIKSMSLKGALKIGSKTVTWERVEITEDNPVESDDLLTPLIRKTEPMEHEALVCQGTSTACDSSNEKSSQGQVQADLSRIEMNSTSGGMIKILFFYYQMSTLPMPYQSEKDVSVLSIAIKSLKAFFNFDLSSYEMDSISCLLPRMDIVKKKILRSLFPMIILCIALTLYLLLDITVHWACKQRCLRRLMKIRLLSVNLNVILLGYATVTSNILALLTCVSLASGKEVLYTEGQVQCYQPWQYVLLSFFISWSVPLVFTLYAILKRLESSSISVRSFYMALLVPLPFSVHFLVKTFAREYEAIPPAQEKIRINSAHGDLRTAVDCDKSESEAAEIESLDIKACLKLRVMKILGGCYRETGTNGARLPWEPMLILQRLILLSLHAFLIHPVTKSLALLSAIFLLTKLNIVVRPFHNKFLNVLNCLCMLFLFTNGIKNSFYAFIYTGGTEVIGPFATTLSALNAIELCMQLSFPCIASIAVLTVIIMRLLYLSVYCLRKIFG